MIRSRTQQGSIGLIALLVSIAILALLFSKTYFEKPVESPEMKEIQPLTASGTEAQTNIEQMHADVDAARAIQVKLNQHGEEINAVLGE